MSQTEKFSEATVLNKYRVTYFRCSSCGFICTEEPYWLEEAYSAAIAGSDLGLVSRNMRLARIATSVLAVLFNRKGVFIDFAGGYGLFVRLMRDKGFDFRWYDKYCQNLFARHFEAAAGETCELLTAFEVFEHLADPVGEVEQMLKHSSNILFTTELLPEPAPRPEEWWYYGVGHGQHIAFFTERSLRLLAHRFSLTLVSDGASCHLLTRKQIPGILFRLVSSFRIAFVLDLFMRRKSLLSEDYKNIA